MKRTFLICFVICLVIPTHTYAEREISILIYHSIDEFKGHGSKELYVTPENFEKQMTYLRNHGFTLLTFEQWGDIDNVKKPVFITLDDGYKNNLNAFTILQRLESEQFHPKVTMFVIADFIGRPNRLSQDDLKMLAHSGLVSVQSHTATHPDLTKVDNLTYELKDSRDKIQAITRMPVIALAYPYGSYNEEVLAETKKYYQYGLTTTPELYSKQGSYLLPRKYVKYSTTLKEFADIVNGSQ